MNNFYEDDYGNIDYTNDIICPYCKTRYSDSYDSIPQDADGEASWKEDCEYCGEKFSVTFDLFNQSDGFSCYKICPTHTYEWDGKRTHEHGDTTFYPSLRSRVYVCTNCGDIEFHPLKEGTEIEYTPTEVTEWEEIRRKERYYEAHPELHPHLQAQGKEVTLRFYDTTMSFETTQSEGNSELFWNIINFLESKGFTCSIEKDYNTGGQFESLGTWNRYLRRGWLEATIEFNRHSVDLMFFQGKINQTNKNGARYGFDHYQRMDVKMRAVFRSLQRSLKKYITNSPTYTVLPNPKGKDQIFSTFQESGKYREKTGQNILNENKLSIEEGSPIGNYRQEKDRDGNVIYNGEYKYWYNNSGKLMRGIVIDRSGSCKYLVHNSSTYSLIYPTALFSYSPTKDPLQLEDRYNLDEKIRRIKAELNRSITDEDFKRCSLLKKLRDKLIQDQQESE